MIETVLEHERSPEDNPNKHNEWFDADGHFIGNEIRGKSNDRVLGRPPYIHVRLDEIEPYIEPFLDATSKKKSLAVIAEAFTVHQLAHWSSFREKFLNLWKIENPDPTEINPQPDRRHASAYLDDDENISVEFNFRGGRVSNVSDDDLFTKAMNRDSCFLGSQPEGKDDGQRCFFRDENDPEHSAAILLNPNAISLKNHLTITFEHVVQKFSRVSHDGFEIARDFGDGWSVFYNGGKEGASAADHAHIQAMQEILPIETDSTKAWADAEKARKEGLDDSDIVRRVDLGMGDEVTAFIPQKLGRSVMVIGGPNLEVTEKALGAAIDRLPMDDNHWEPNMNVVMACRTNDQDEEIYQAYLLPRAAFRPKSHNEPDSEFGLISAGFGALEMSGKMVFPIGEHFDKFFKDGEFIVDKAARYMLKSWKETSMPMDEFLKSYEQ